MLRYNLISDSVDPYPVARMLIQPDRKVIVPVYINSEDPDGPPEYGSLYKHEKGVELLVFTSVMLIPEDNEAPGVCFCPMMDLMESILEEGEVTVIRIDPGTDHGVGFLIKNGKPSMFRLKGVEEYMKSQEGSK